ncbi:MAG: hypothetical protein LBQ47_06845 [Endomicrobium sp.]|jgi:hypothetical protein|nr:hypothetical protein [Endomicrobium sp.]
MKTYTVRYNGKTYKVQGKDNATEEELKAFMDNNAEAFEREQIKNAMPGIFSQGLLNKAQEGLAVGFADALSGVGAADGAGLYDVMRGKNPFNSTNAQIAARQRKEYNIKPLSNPKYKKKRK